MSSNHSSDCTLHNPEWRACCCNCRYHLRDYHHCTTPEGSLLRSEKYDNKCVCSVPRGWVCAAFWFAEKPGDGRVHSGWGEHGLCEMHVPNDRNDARADPGYTEKRRDEGGFTGLETP